MNIVIRTDASVSIGSGHVFRCLALANGLSENGHKCLFICREHNGHLAEKIKSNGHEVILLAHKGNSERFNQDNADLYAQWLGVPWQIDASQTIKALRGLKYDWLIVDHYGLDHRWQTALRGNVDKILVIDDLANLQHNCDILLDQNLGIEEASYRPLLPSDCTTLVGPKFALLRPEFSRFRARLFKTPKEREKYNILISFGGVDKLNITEKVLDALAKTPLSFAISLDIVMGSSSIHLEDIRKKAGQLPFPTSIASDVDNMAERMSIADLSIGAAGSTSWERCCLGLFSIVTIVADNQRAIAKAVEKEGAAFIMEVDEISNRLPIFLEQFFDQSTDYDKIKQQVSDICDGRGVERVISHMLR